jgi:hypothetical protein
MSKYLIKIITESNNVHNPNDKTNSGSFSQILVIEKDGQEILRKPSTIALADFLNKEFEIPVVEIKQTYSEDWWNVESGVLKPLHSKCGCRNLSIETIVEKKCICPNLELEPDFDCPIHGR